MWHPHKASVHLLISMIQIHGLRHMQGAAIISSSSPSTCNLNMQKDGCLPYIQCWQANFRALVSNKTLTAA